MSKPIPLDKKLYDQVSKRASEIFSSNRGIYRSAWIVKEYKRLGGKYSQAHKPNVNSAGLKRWFAERWVDLNRPKYDKKGHIIGYDQCGRKDASKGEYPLCRPSIRITKKTPKTIKELKPTAIAKAKLDKKTVKGKSNIKFNA